MFQTAYAILSYAFYVNPVLIVLLLQNFKWIKLTWFLHLFIEHLRQIGITLRANNKIIYSTDCTSHHFRVIPFEHFWHCATTKHSKCECIFTWNFLEKPRLDLPLNNITMEALLVIKSQKNNCHIRNEKNEISLRFTINFSNIGSLKWKFFIHW